MRLLAGSYERTLWGFKIKPLQSGSKHPSLTQLFSHSSHLSYIKAVAVGGPIAASAAADDTIKLYDLPSTTEIATLTPYNSSTTCLCFFTLPSLSFPINLFSGSENGSMAIFDTDPFVLLKTVPAHRSAINDIAVHPSGKVALTVGHDSCLAMLNLVRGKKSFYCSLPAEATIIKFDFSAEKFFRVSRETISVHESEDARIISEFESQKRVLCAAQSSNAIILSGGEDRNITAWDIKSGKAAYCIEGAHSARVKGIVVLNNNERDDGEPFAVTSASSDGVIRVWDARMVGAENPNPLAEAKTESRITCLAGSSHK